MISLSRIIAYWAERQPQAIAIVHEQQRMSWADLEAETNRLARAYAEAGVAQDDFVTVALPNGIEFFLSCFAVWKLGATPQPVSARLPQLERQQIVELASPKLVVGVTDSSGDCPTLPPGYAPATTLSADPLPELTATSFKAMTSGGSTGRPKLIVSKLPAATDPDAPALNLKQQGSVLIPGPLYHNGPFLWAMFGLFRGNKVTVTTRFDAENTLRLIAAERVDTLYLVPTMMQRIWNLPEATRIAYDVSSLATLWHLAAPCPAWLKREYIAWFGADVIWELYGGTEGQGSTTISGSEWLAHPGSVGRPVETCEIRVLRDDGSEAAADEVGEVFLRPRTGPGTTYRYIGAEPKQIDGGWESLGDLGYLDADGYLYLSDRLNDMILSGGANIYPAEVEAAIDACPGVRSSAVIGLPDADLGNRVHAIVDVPAQTLDEATLLEFLKERLVVYKLPRSIEFVSEPLRDDAGKVRRSALKAERTASADQLLR
ncbi:MAG: AMP-binding protein [Pseudomonadota bacterium]